VLVNVRPVGAGGHSLPGGRAIETTSAAATA
jgi:hypothetical protein